MAPDKDGGETPFHDTDGSLAKDQMLIGEDDDSIVFEDDKALDLADEIAADIEDDDAAGTGAGPAAGDEDEDEILVDEEEQAKAGAETGDELPPGSDAIDDNLKGLPPKIANRIMRERRLARQARAEADDEVGRIRAENAELKRGAVVLQRVTLTRETENAKARISQLTDDLAQARDDGETRKAIEIEEQIAELKRARTQMEEALARLPSDDDLAAATETPTRQRGSDVKGKTPLATRWLAEQKDWWETPKNRSIKAFALAEDAAMSQEGYDPATPEYFTELTRRIARRFPEIPVRTHEGKRIATGQKRRGGDGRTSAVQVQRTATGTGRQNPNKVTLTADDKRNMVRFGLDPANKEHLRAYAAERRASERSA
ncbi:MAG: hypothetical protein KF895_02990 [Parvibaculum sp.]|nr:hypothetical protein [Parvibaculum sp.]